MTFSPTIAYFITPHGFGHASRAAAVMQALAEQVPGSRFEIFTTCPRWIFEDSLQRPFGYHGVCTDIGMVQRSPIEEDAMETCRRLDRWLPFDSIAVDNLAAHLKQLHCRIVVCDISVLGIAAARVAGIPSILIENFTWDWIYGAYAPDAPGLRGHASYLQGLLGQASLHIQTRPLCRRIDHSLLVAPIARMPRTGRSLIRRRLGIPSHRKMVLVSMGGVPDQFEFLDHMADETDVCLVIPGCSADDIRRPGVYCLDAHSAFYHPDLMAAADAVIGKAGYSTVAEAYYAGLPFGYINRPRFPESAVLERFLREHMACRPVSIDAYSQGLWIKDLPRLLALPHHRPASENGAVAAARAIADMLG